jgi:hypothetical protein
MSLMRPFAASIRACGFASSVVTPRGYKDGGHPCTNLCPLVETPIASSPPSLFLKRMRGTEIDLEAGEKVVELTGRHFSFASEQWRSRAGSLQWLHMLTCRAS